jgi:VCBS repeat-containing protein
LYLTTLGNALRLTGLANYEAKSSYSLRIRVTDAGGLWYEEAFTININDVNEAPTDTALSASSINENVAVNTTVGTLSSTDADAGNTFTYTLVTGDGSTDNSAFSISGSSLRISYSPNFEVKNSYSVRVRTTDQGGLWYEKAFTININDVNEAPTDIALSASSINENVTGNTTVGSLTATDADAGNTFTYTLVAGTGDTDNSAFNISGSSLRITNSPNFEAKNSYSVRVCTTDQNGLTYEKALTITINNVNEDPTDIALSVGSVDENVSENTVVGTLSSTDPDGANTFTYSLVAGDGATDNGSFNIDGNGLRITNSPNFETKNSYSVRVRTTDQGGLWCEKALTITINNVNEAPAEIALSNNLINENVGANTTVGTLSSTDPDAGNTFTYSLVSGAGSTDNGAFNIDGSNLRITNSPNFESKSSYSARVCTTDQDGLWYEKIFTITINDINEAPVISTASTLSVTEGTTAAFTAAASDPEGGTISWSITGGADAAKFTIVAGTGVVTFGTAPSFRTPTDTDTNNSYILEITASDGTMTSAKTVTVTVTQRVNSGGGGSTTSTTSSTGAVVEVNGEKQDAGQTSTQTTGGQTVTTITVDDAKLNAILDQKDSNATVTLPVNTASDVVVGELNGQTVKNMENKAATLEIRTETVTYTLPASQINIDAVSSQLGSQVELKDIKVSVRIAEPPAETVKVVEDTASRGNYQLVVKPVEFEITCTSGDQKIAISRFNGYVERTIAIPDGVDPAKITTGIVLNADGTFRHVPTQIVVIDGKYYAKINSLTNSTYSVVYNPVIFADVVSHWAKDAINDMGSRMVVTGIGSGIYEPERSITRAEFAAIIARALGLAQGMDESAFGDVSLTDWFNGYVDTATLYNLITGYDSVSFAPNDTITREQAMTILARAMKLTGLNVSLTDSEVSALLANYTDAGLVSDYAKAGAAACIKTGVVSGTTAATISPKDDVTRAEVAVMVQRLLQKSGLI